ncbi:putative long chain fatty alcohol oxidase [Aspergillus ruber CBS 135680]|uniref:Long-chain-alcohol oxidase n=1 Tax=Aspergillus ruber (strain CBS 135680) TaxID=1388766 RepID=A0A017SPR0_ASPRC|nr:putative long chain fatty alcohol oxidase [Aspergillus ruber CBS 135680]EYE98796.1 putative long chain fatty alcohol oxidase [Aspergillus ruber CBS 135680]
MAEQAVSTYTPLDAPVPPVPTAEIFSKPQWQTLLALADTVIPSIKAREGPHSSNDKVVSSSEVNKAVAALAASIPGPDANQVAVRYLEERPSANPDFRNAIQRLFAEWVHDEGKNGMSMVLSALNSKPGSLILTGSTTPIAEQPLEVRERVFRGWETSRLKPIRAVYRALTAIFKKTWVTMSPTICPVIGFPRVPVHGKAMDGHEYEFLQMPPGDEPETIETDVVIVGSGCGGGVAAKNLAEAGHNVLVVEKSYHHSTRHFPMRFNEGFTNLFESGGATMSDDGAMAVLSGSTWGGGGTVNWSASLQTQGYVRQEWANAGLPFFTSLEFQTALDRVFDRMGVNSNIEHNHSNRVILEGARKLGYAAKPVPQNTGNGEHYCGYCTMGCHSTGKKGPTESYLADAAKAGAKFMEGFNADKVLFDQTDGGRVASGVEGTWTSRDTHFGTSGDVVTRKVIIKAKTVIVSCGTLHSPLLLLRSGLKNSHIGKHLHLHPVSLAAAVFDEEVRPWEGSALTTVVNEFENMDGQGHGVKIENLSMLPAVFIPTFPWRDGLDYKMWAAKFPRMSGFITLTKERDAGRVYPDPVDGRCRIDYTVSSYDRKHMLEALIATAKIAYISGAREFHSSCRALPPFIRSSDSKEASEGTNSADLQEWIAEVRRHPPLDPERTLFASAHQMGTCRMGKSPRTSVVDADCRVWGTKGLYVLDASVFPSASGVNPMVTNMAIADWASRNITKSMARNGNVLARL